MTYAHGIFDYSTDLLGTLDQTQTAWLETLSFGAEQELTARLRPGVDISKFSELFTVAGALLCVSMMKQLDDPGLADFTAATVKLTFSEDRSQLAQTAYRMIAPWCADGFAFRGVTA